MADDQKFSDKALWEKAAAAIHAGTLRGALAGADEWEHGRLDTLEIIWTSRPRFKPDGTVYSDSDEPGVGPVQVTSRYVWTEPKPALEKP